MRSTRRLTLRKEALTDLTPADLDAVGGGQQQQTWYCPMSLLQCFTTNVKACQTLSAAIQDCPLH